MGKTQQQGIVTIGYMHVLCSSVSAAADLVKVLSKCTEINWTYEDGQKVYKQKTLEVSMEAISLKPVEPKPKPREPAPPKEPRTVKGRTLQLGPPKPTALELPWT